MVAPSLVMATADQIFSQVMQNCCLGKLLVVIGDDLAAAHKAPSRDWPHRLVLALVLACLHLVAAAPWRQAMAEVPPVLQVSAGGTAITLSRTDIEAMPQHVIRTSTPWTEGILTFQGPLLRDVLARAGISAADGKKIQATALNDYMVEIPLADAFEHDVIVAIRENGAYLPIRKRGPFFIVYQLDEPQFAEERYYSRCAWQLRSLDVR